LKLTVETKEFEYTSGLKNQSAFRGRTSYLIKLQSNGLTGLGETAPLAGWTESDEACRQKLEEIDINTLDDVQYYESELDEHPALRHGLNQAHLDWVSRNNQMPLSAYLRDDNGRPSKVETYYSIVETELRSRIDEVRTGLELGFNSFKFKASEDPKLEIPQIDDLHRSSESKFTSRIDFNESCSSPDELRTVSEERFQHIEYLEQPFERENLEDHQISREVVGVALDESLYSHSADRLVEEEVADYWILKPMALGGLDRARTLATTALRNDIQPVVTTVFDGIVGRMGAIQLVASLDVNVPSGLATALFVKNDSNWDFERIKNGVIEIPDDPGLGLPDELS
jgi:L-alanine-DL-glutamate epimerase-like enolase superfamily enzyme